MKSPARAILLVLLCVGLFSASHAVSAGELSGIQAMWNQWQGLLTTVPTTTYSVPWTTNTLTAPCSASYYGLACDGSGNIVTVYVCPLKLATFLQHWQLFSPNHAIRNFGSLSGLIFLLRSNIYLLPLTGTIPPELGNMTNLQTLYVRKPFGSAQSRI